jgi:hypothetical protein
MVVMGETIVVTVALEAAMLATMNINSSDKQSTIM